MHWFCMIRNSWPILTVVLTTIITSQKLSSAEWKPYGFIRATPVFSSGAVASYGFRNMSAPTSADINFERTSDAARFSFQVAQSRLGSQILINPQLSGTIEFDYIDFSKASPTVQALPRVRLMNVVYQPNTDWKFLFGQDWDTFLPLTPYDYNFVGSYFTSGNAGFMRQQAKFTYLGMSDKELQLSLGLPGSNPASADAGLELSVLPSIAISLLLKTQDWGKILVAAIGARLLEKESFNQSYLAWGIGASWDYNAQSTHIKSELRLSQNLAATGTLTNDRYVSGVGNNQELGAWITVKQDLTPSYKIVGGVGVAHLLSPQNVATYTGPGTGILQNATLKLGLESWLQPELAIIAQLSHFRTTYQTQNMTVPTGGVMPTSPTQGAVVFEVGALYQF